MIEHDEYVRIFRQVPRLCVSVIVQSAAGIALVRRNIAPEIGRWHLPGGRVFKGETLVEAAQRVVKRELGADAAIGALVGYIEALSEIYEYEFYMHNVDVVFDAVYDGELSPAAGEGEARWFVTPPPSAECHSRHIQFLVERGYL